jgi:hypothetical protein
MKKRFGFMLLAIVLIFILSACGSEKPAQPPIPVDSESADSAPPSVELDETENVSSEPASGEEQIDASDEGEALINPDFVSLEVAQDFPFPIGNTRVFAQFGEYGVIRVTGVIRNEFQTPLVNVAIRGNLKDSAGNLITTMETRVYNRILFPGENGLFDLSTLTADHQIEPGEYVVEITQWNFEEATDDMVAMDYSQAITADLESISNEELSEGMSYEGYFSVKNMGDQTAASTLVSCFYGSAKNEILFITIEEIGEILPGESITYLCGLTFPADVFETTPMSSRIDLEVSKIAVSIDALVK